MMNVSALLSKKAILLGIGFSLVFIFGMLNAIGIIPGLTYSSAVISEVISKNPFQVYEINTVCELADLMLENHFSFQVYMDDFEKQLPTEWNERMSIQAESEKFWKEISDQQKNLGSRYLTAEEEITIQKIEHRNKISSYTMVMKYFSVNPDLEGTFVALYEYNPLSLLWLKEYHPECMPLLEEKYG
ncbi:MAG: hypothetical protein NPMRTH1_1250019 [Nitrosopumilales archaeon]|nr:MAG: hypothetical protein NPMRTH1_1250019 [Nitrosopumilales archaeon]